MFLPSSNECRLKRNALLHWTLFNLALINLGSSCSGHCHKQLPSTELVSTPPATPSWPTGGLLRLPAILGSIFANTGVSDKEGIGAFCQDCCFFLPNKPGGKALCFNFMALRFQKTKEFFFCSLIDVTLQFGESSW